MKRAWKKLAAVLLAAVMAVGILPMSAVTVSASGGSFKDLQELINGVTNGAH